MLDVTMSYAANLMSGEEQMCTEMTRLRSRAACDDVTAGLVEGEEPSARASCWHDAFTCCVDVVDTDMQDAHVHECRVPWRVVALLAHVPSRIVQRLAGQGDRPIPRERTWSEKKRASTHAVDVFEDSRSIVIM
jgi:hypothetical protein